MSHNSFFIEYGRFFLPFERAPDFPAPPSLFQKHSLSRSPRDFLCSHSLLVRRENLCYTANWESGVLYMEKIRTTVKVAGKEYTIASYDSEAYVQRVAAYVDRKIREASMATRLPSAQLSVLVAMNIADDMLKAHDEIQRLKKDLGETRKQLEALKK